MSKRSKRKDESITTFMNVLDGTTISFKKTSDNPEDQKAMDEIMEEIIAEIKRKFGKDSIKKVTNKK